MADTLQLKVYHKAHLMSERGVSALCFKQPRSIDLKRALWTLRDEAVTCAKCLKVMRQQNAM